MAPSWRSAADWQSCGLPLTTGSNNACKLYDAALTQYITWSDDPTMGGLEKTVVNCIAEDPNFVMGQALAVGLELISTGRSMESFEQDIINLNKLTSNQPVTEREKKHVKAIQLYAEGFHERATDVWEDILLDHPTDILALKFAHDCYFFLGQSNNIRNSIASVLPLWEPSDPLYSYLHGMYAFGLEETNMYPQAEKEAKKGLELNKNDAWATHALAHVYEMQGRTNEGIAFMSTTVGNWKSSNLLAKHNYWHWALYHIEQGEMDAAVDIFENCLNPGIRSGSMLDIVDCTSMLWRLTMEGVEVNKLWTDVMDTCRSHLDDHFLLFNDMHFLMACLGSGDTEATTHLTNSFHHFLDTGEEGSNWTTSKKFGAEVYESMVAVSEGRYSDAVSLLYPVRGELYKMGGSHAQRDLFDITLIAAAVKSQDPKDQALARKLLLARKMVKGSCTLARRLNCQFQPFLAA